MLILRFSFVDDIYSSFAANYLVTFFGMRAEDESGKQRDSAKREAEEVMRRAQERFACDREARLKAAHSDALAQIESARKSAEMEALHIAEMGRRGRERMRENYEIGRAHV